MRDHNLNGWVVTARSRRRSIDRPHRATRVSHPSGHRPSGSWVKAPVSARLPRRCATVERTWWRMARVTKTLCSGPCWCHAGMALVVSTCALQAVPVAAGAADAVAGMKATSARTANRTATCTRIHAYPERPIAVLMPATVGPGARAAAAPAGLVCLPQRSEARVSHVSDLTLSPAACVARRVVEIPGTPGSITWSSQGCRLTPSEAPGSTPTLPGRPPTAIPMLPEASQSDPLRTLSRGGCCSSPLTWCTTGGPLSSWLGPSGPRPDRRHERRFDETVARDPQINGVGGPSSAKA